MPELRCANKKFGEVANGTGLFEATCNSRFCKVGNEVVLHIWDLEKITEQGTILPIETKRFKRPK